MHTPCGVLAASGVSSTAGTQGSSSHLSSASAADAGGSWTLQSRQPVLVFERAALWDFSSSIRCLNLYSFALLPSPSDLISHYVKEADRQFILYLAGAA